MFQLIFLPTLLVVPCQETTEERASQETGRAPSKETMEERTAHRAETKHKNAEEISASARPSVHKTGQYKAGKIHYFIDLFAVRQAYDQVSRIPCRFAHNACLGLRVTAQACNSAWSCFLGKARFRILEILQWSWLHLCVIRAISRLCGHSSSMRNNIEYGICVLGFRL